VWITLFKWCDKHIISHSFLFFNTDGKILSRNGELLEYEKTITAAKAPYAYSDAAKAYR